MVQIRENMQKHKTSGLATMVLLCASLPTRATRIYGFDIVVAWTKEAAP